MLTSQERQWFDSNTTLHPDIYQAILFSSGSALSLFVWDTLLTLGDEIDYIWSKPHRTWIKWIYLFSKWFGLVNQICIQIWISMLAIYAPATVTMCRAYFAMEATTFHVLLLCLDSVLFIRICALYRRDRRYILAALLAICVEIIMAIVSQSTSIPRISFDDTCIQLNGPRTSLLLVVGLVTSQSVLLYLTYRGKLLIKAPPGRSNIISIVIRDGVFAFGTITGLVAMCTLYSLFNQSKMNVLFPWLPAIPSIATSRLILNLQTAEEIPPSQPGLELTTFFDCTLTAEGSSIEHPHTQQDKNAGL